MKSINTLIKINSRELDELRKEVVRQEEEKQRLIDENNNMEEQLQREHVLASNDPEMGVAFANYRRFIRGKQANIEKSLKNLDKRIDALKEDIAVKFGEVKKYEILLSSKMLEEQKKISDMENKEMDAIAINNHLKEDSQ